MSPTETINRIAALCDEQEAMDSAQPGPPGAGSVVFTDEVRAILAEVTPEPGGAFDRDQAREVLRPFVLRPLLGEALDALEGCVRPATIDRDALLALVQEARYSRGARWTDERFVDAILALVRPVAGVALTPEEAALAAEALRSYRVRNDVPEVRALASRLEATR